MQSVDDLTAVLGKLTDEQRRDYAWWVNAPALLDAVRAGGERGRVADRAAIDRAFNAFYRVGDGTLSEADSLALYGRSGVPDVDAAMEAIWYEAAAVIAAIAAAMLGRDEANLETLRPACDWLETAASDGAPH